MSVFNSMVEEHAGTLSALQTELLMEPLAPNRRLILADMERYAFKETRKVLEGFKDGCLTEAEALLLLRRLFKGGEP